jgi:site-specific DNA-methyltransferase (adenine-specific)
MSTINLYNTDCMEFMRGLPDKYYELAIVDPPYGIGLTYDKKTKTWGAGKKTSIHSDAWDFEKPTKKWANELFRVSKNQIVWGANHFIESMCLNSSCWIVWDKQNGSSYFADCELAWTSFQTAVRIFKLVTVKSNRIHPTQKPVALYKWLLKNYAKAGDKILDTHGGSMSIAIACHDMGFDLDLCELDPDYYAAGVKRYEQHKAQLSMFTPDEVR